MKRQNLALSYEPSLIQYLSDVGTDVKNGARPLERLIKRKVLAPISAKSLTLIRGHKPIMFIYGSKERHQMGNTEKI